MRTVFWGFLSLKMFVWYERSVRTVWHPLCLLSTPGSIDLLIDKQELTKNKALNANGLYDSDAICVCVRRQFEGKIFGFRINSGTFVGIYHSLHRAKRPPWTASPSPSPALYLTLGTLSAAADLAHSLLTSVQDTVPCLGHLFKIYLKSNSKFGIIRLC